MPKKVLEELDARALPVSLKEAAKQQFDVSFEKAHSMRCITFLAVCLTVSSMAQNWALINPAYRYNYSDDGTDTISNQIRVVHIDTLGPDSFRYELNRITVPCADCGLGQTSDCYFSTGQAYARTRQVQFLGENVQQYGGRWTFGLSDGWLVAPGAGLDSTWTCPNGLTASVFAIDTAMVLNSLDSVKWIGYSNGDTACLSMNHGIILFTSQLSAVYYTLRGLEEDVTTEGIGIPDQESLFNYQLGDMLLYITSGNYTDGYGVYYTDGSIMYTFIERQALVGSTTYSVQVANHIHHWCYTVMGWYPCGSGLDYWNNSVDTVQFTIYQGPLVPENPFNPYWQTDLWPGAEGFVSYPMDPLTAVVAMRVDSIGQYVVEQSLPADPSGTDDSRVFCTAESDSSLIISTPEVIFHTSFTAGIGLTKEALYYFEGGTSRELVGYLLNGHAWGAILLDVSENKPLTTLRVFPNPACDQLTVDGLSKGAKNLLLHDASGRLCRAVPLWSSDHATLDVSDLAPGVYVLRVLPGEDHRRIMVSR